MYTFKYIGRHTWVCIYAYMYICTYIHILPTCMYMYMCMLISTLNCLNRIFLQTIVRQTSANSSLKRLHQVYWKMLYLPKHTYHRLHTDAKKGETGSPQGRTILSNIKNMSVCSPSVPWGRLNHCEVVV